MFWIVKEISVIVSEFELVRMFVNVMDVWVAAIEEEVLIPELTFKTGSEVVDNNEIQLVLPEFWLKQGKVIIICPFFKIGCPGMKLKV
jgi:hypothetical protein